MTPSRLTSIYMGGAMPFRSRALARLFVLRAVKYDAARAVQVAMRLPDQARGFFAIDLEAYSASEFRWLWFELWTARDYRLGQLAVRELALGVRPTRGL